MRGSGFQDGKFRIAEFFQEHNPSNKEFANFLKDEYGTGGHTADGKIFMVDHDSKGMQFTLRSTDGGISDEKFDFSWTEVAKLTADLIRHDKYITQDDIDRRNQCEVKTERSDTEPEIVTTASEKPELSREAQAEINMLLSRLKMDCDYYLQTVMYTYHKCKTSSELMITRNFYEMNAT